MNQQAWGADGGAREALSSAVANYGPRVLSDARILGNMVTDLLPDSPRERSLLVAAAETDIAAQLHQHIEEQHIDPATAVRLAAGTLSDQKSIEPAACLWVTTEYARALGYQVPDSLAEGPLAVPPPMAGVPGAGAGVGVGGPGAGGPGASGAGATPPPIGMPPVPGGVHDNQTQAAPDQTVPGAPSWPGAWPPPGSVSPTPGGPSGSWQGGWPPPQGPGWSSGSVPQPVPRSSGGGKRAVIAVTVVVALAGLYFLIAGVSKIPPFQAAAAATTTPSTTKLTDVLTNTGHVTDPTTQCSAAVVPSGLILPGMTEALSCTVSGLPGGNVYAYQMDTSADYQTAWTNYNHWWLFDTVTAETSCPPTGSKTAHATDPWYSDTYPQKTGQVIECEWVGTNYTIPAYTWTVPSANAIVIAQGASGTSFDALNTWWSGSPSASGS
jgi:hypothetical protein